MEINLTLSNGNQLGVSRSGIEAIVVTNKDGVEWAQLLFRNEKIKTKQGEYPSYKITGAKYPNDMKEFKKQDGYIRYNEDCILCIEQVNNYAWITFTCGEKYKVMI